MILGQLIEILPSSLAKISKNVRWLALTATATPEVKNDIIENLEFKKSYHNFRILKEII